MRGGEASVTQGNPWIICLATNCTHSVILTTVSPPRYRTFTTQDGKNRIILQVINHYLRWTLERLIFGDRWEGSVSIDGFSFAEKNPTTLKVPGIHAKPGDAASLRRHVQCAGFAFTGAASGGVIPANRLGRYRHLPWWGRSTVTRFGRNVSC